MPKRRTYKRRITKKNKGAKDKTVTVWSNHSVLEKANRALNMASQIYRFVNVETKYHDVANTLSPTYGGSLISLSAIPQGDSNTKRDGASIKPLNLTMRGYLTGNATTENTQMRIIIFRGKQENSIVYTPADILEITGTVSSINSPKNYSERFRSQVLYDQRFTLNNSVSGTGVRKQISKVIKLTGHTTYDDGDTTGSSIENGGLYMVAFSDQPTNTPSFTYFFRQTFTDN